jgi:hypothetical protein
MSKIDVKVIQTTAPDFAQKERILELWNKEYPEQLQYADLSAFDGYLNGLKNPRHYFGLAENRIVSWAFVFERDMENWFAIIVDGTLQRCGHGTQLLRLLKQSNSVLNGWATDHNWYKKADGAVYESPLEFYKHSGFKVLADVRLETEKLSAVKIIWNTENENSGSTNQGA